jgi:hypothetical protein
MPSRRFSEGTQTVPYATPLFSLKIQITDTGFVQKCKDCVQEIVDWEPEIEVQLEEMKIREDTERGGTTVSNV